MGVEAVAIAAFVGGMSVALLGWAESQEPFNPRKFLASVIRSLIAALVFSIGSSGEITWPNLFYAYLGGAGVDVLGNRLSAKLIGKGGFPL